MAINDAPSESHQTQDRPPLRRSGFGIVLVAITMIVFQFFNAWAEGFRLPWLLFPWPLLSCCGCYILPVVSLVGAITLCRRVIAGDRFTPALTTVSVLTLIAIFLWALQFGILPAVSALGRRQVESEVGIATLANECLDLVRNRPNAEDTSSRIAPPYPSAIARLRPNYVFATDRECRIELFGGFDHYGYRLYHEWDSDDWVLEWYTETVHEPLFTVTAQQKP